MFDDDKTLGEESEALMAGNHMNGVQALAFARQHVITFCFCMPISYCSHTMVQVMMLSLPHAQVMTWMRSAGRQAGIESRTTPGRP